MKAVLILKSNSEMVGAKIKMIIKMNQNKHFRDKKHQKTTA